MLLEQIPEELQDRTQKRLTLTHDSYILHKIAHLINTGSQKNQGYISLHWPNHQALNA